MNEDKAHGVLPGRVRARRQSAVGTSADGGRTIRTHPRSAQPLSGQTPLAPKAPSDLRIRTLTTPGTQQAAYSPLDDNKEQEPAIMTVNVSGLEYSATAFMRYNVSGGVQLWTAQKGGTQQTLARTYGYNSGDAAMTANPYGSTGTAPHRMYVIGTDYAFGNYPGGIHVWYSDDGATTWSSGSQLAWDEGLIVDQNGHHWFDDKPSIAVSLYSGTCGVIYAAFVRIDLTSGNTNSNPNQIFVLRSTDGGQSFVATAILSSTYVSPSPNYSPPSNAPHSPQIAVDWSTGNVFLFWLDWTTNHIYCAYSGPNADTFTGLTGIDTGILLGLNNTDVLPAAPDGSLVRARSMLSVRTDWPCHNFGVTWHAREGGTTSNSDVKFGVLDAGTFAWSGPAGGAPGVLTDGSPSVSGSDQWNAALDIDSNWNWIVTWYDRRLADGGLPNLKYRLYGTSLTTCTGSRRESTDTELTTGDPSDPRHAQNSGLFELGEYQDVWCLNGVCRGAYVYAPDTSNPIDPTRYIDVYFSDILP